ncbi:MAG TPA: alanine--glyoxylate aminotransferase family protein [Candidatus Thermoplasmatota archaeon]|nr:alanine--glyoxylate aminotransferase family protein [Candidatus Thermoplasmatota archaeon]
MPFDPEDNLFLLAGPIRMHPRVLRAMERPAINHRAPEFAAVARELHDLLQYAFDTQNPVLALTGSGTLGMEAAIQSLVDKQDKVVAVANGNFGERMAGLADLYGTCTTVKAAWGQPVDLAAVESALRGGAKAVVLTHNETSTGFTNPLREIARLAHDHGALVIADCITSIGGIPVPVDAWGVDVAITGSQKCIGAPPGLAFVSLSPEAERALKPKKSYYLSLSRYLEKWRKEGQSPFTPATHLYFACVEGLRLLKEQGREARFSQVAATARATRAGAQALGLSLFAHEAHRSDTVSAIRYPSGVEDAKFRGALKEKRGVVVSGGQGPVKGSIFRIGHMGTVGKNEIAAAFAAVAATLNEQGFKCDAGAAAQAVSQA